MAIWIGIGIFASAVGLIYTIFANQKLKKEFDSNVNDMTKEHPILANPIVIGYFLFPLLIVLGAAILLIYY